MEHAQLLSPIAKATCLRWALEGRGEHPTTVNPPGDAVTDISGERTTWAELMHEALKQPEPPVHPAIECFETMLAADMSRDAPQLGVRVRAEAAALLPETFLGFYQGWVGTSVEAREVMAQQHAAGRLLPCAPSLLHRVRAELDHHSYSADLVLLAGRPFKQLVVAPVAPSGLFVGNLLARVNDGIAEPFSSAPDQEGAAVAADTEPLCAMRECTVARAERVAVCDAARARSRASNVVFVQILHGGWVYLAMKTSAAVGAGEELLLEYGQGHWDQVRQLTAQVAMLERMQRPAQGFAALSRALALATLGARRRLEDAERTRAARRLREEEAARMRRQREGGADGAGGGTGGGSFTTLTVPKEALLSRDSFDREIRERVKGGGGGLPCCVAPCLALCVASSVRAVTQPRRVLAAAAAPQRPFCRGSVVYEKPEGSADRMANGHVERRAGLCAPTGGAQWWGRPHALRYSCAWELGDRPRRCALLFDDVQEEYRALMPAGQLRKLESLLAAARAGGVLVLWSVWARTAADDGQYGALDEFFGPYGTENGENPLYLRRGAEGARILAEVAPRDEAEREGVIDSFRFDCFARKA